VQKDALLTIFLGIKFLRAISHSFFDAPLGLSVERRVGAYTEKYKLFGGGAVARWSVFNAGLASGRIGSCKAFNNKIFGATTERARGRSGGEKEVAKLHDTILR
jgi:hypothetical protein